MKKLMMLGFLAAVLMGSYLVFGFDGRKISPATRQKITKICFTVEGQNICVQNSNLNLNNSIASPPRCYRHHILKTD